MILSLSCWQLLMVLSKLDTGTSSPLFPLFSLFIYLSKDISHIQPSFIVTVLLMSPFSDRVAPMVGYGGLREQPASWDRTNPVQILRT